MGVEVILSGHQPVYLPGIVVLTKIALSDACMLVGHCQFQNKSWHSRNYIRGPSGPLLPRTIRPDIPKCMTSSLPPDSIKTRYFPRRRTASTVEPTSAFKALAGGLR